jgi:hypothetical protein
LIVATAGLLLVHAGLMSTTTVGVEALFVVPFPSSPYVFIPQHRTRPPPRTAQLSSLPAATLVAVVMPLTTAGVNALAVVPLPIWPLAL